MLITLFHKKKLSNTFSIFWLEGEPVDLAVMTDNDLEKVVPVSMLWLSVTIVHRGPKSHQAEVVTKKFSVTFLVIPL